MKKESKENLNEGPGRFLYLDQRPRDVGHGHGPQPPARPLPQLGPPRLAASPSQTASKAITYPVSTFVSAAAPQPVFGADCTTLPLAWPPLAAPPLRAHARQCACNMTRLRNGGLTCAMHCQPRIIRGAAALRATARPGHGEAATQSHGGRDDVSIWAQRLGIGWGWAAGQRGLRRTSPAPIPTVSLPCELPPPSINSARRKGGNVLFAGRSDDD